MKTRLIEIINALIYLMEDDREKSVEAMLRSIKTFHNIYRENFKLSGSSMRVRIKARMIVGYICSSKENFPKSEKLWRFLHGYAARNNREYFENYLGEERFYPLEQECIQEIDEAIALYPIETADYNRIMKSFEMMRHLAHITPPEGGIFENETVLEDEDWLNINPWQLPRGKSMLIDYWWDIPLEDREKGHKFLNKLASKEITSVEALKELREEVAQS